MAAGFVPMSECLKPDTLSYIGNLLDKQAKILEVLSEKLMETVVTKKQKGPRVEYAFVNKTLKTPPNEGSSDEATSGAHSMPEVADGCGELAPHRGSEREAPISGICGYPSSYFYQNPI